MRESVPLYKQLKSQLLEHIRAGKFVPGTQLPSEAELAHTYGVSRTTVRQAVGDLVSSGYIIRRQGKGTYVAEQIQSATATTLYGFAEALRTEGRNVRVNIERTELVACPIDLQTTFKAPTGRKVLHIERTAWVDEVCYFYDDSHILPPFHLNLEQAMKSPDTFNFIYGFLEENGIRINSGHQTISAQIANEADCARFELQSPAAILVIERTTRDESGSAVEVSRVKYPADRYRFSVNLLRQPDA